MNTTPNSIGNPARPWEEEQRTALHKREATMNKLVKRMFEKRRTGVQRYDHSPAAANKIQAELLDLLEEERAAGTIGLLEYRHMKKSIRTIKA